MQVVRCCAFAPFFVWPRCSALAAWKADAGPEIDEKAFFALDQAETRQKADEAVSSTANAAVSQGAEVQCLFLLVCDGNKLSCWKRPSDASELWFPFPD